MSLLDEAVRAVEIANAFSKFRDPVADQAAEIASAIVELTELSFVLRETDILLSASDGRTISLVKEDLNLVLSSVVFTLEDIWVILGRIGNGDPNPSSNAYRQTWKEIHFHCRAYGRLSLSLRLELYKRFLLELGTVLKRRPSLIRVIEDLRGNIQDVFGTQDRRLITSADATAGLAMESAVVIPRTRSYERERDRDRDRPPVSPTNSRDSYTRDGFPAMTEIPNSPTGTYSTTSRTSSADTDTSHWAREVFRDVTTISSTPLPQNVDVPQCYGESMRYAKDHLDHKFDELFKIKFGEGLCVRLYHRERDHRAKVLCETPERSGHYWYSCLPLNAIECVRDQSSIHLCQPRRGQRPLCWATLQFSTIERMVLFHCIFLSLRSHDNGKPFSNIRDHELRDEEEFFGGRIRDDDYIHALRVCRDRHSKSIRLQASVLLGDMKNTPVWTAFVTHSIHSPTWQRRVDRNTVYLRELRRHIFSPRYEAHVAPTGEHVLEFTTEADATGFMHTINDLAENSHRI